MKKILLAIFLAALTAGFIPPWNKDARAADTLTINIQVTNQGFFTQDGKKLHKINITQGTAVALYLHFRDYGPGANNLHQFELVSPVSTVYSEKIDKHNKTTYFKFVAGNNGEKWYRISCIILCFGMENLIDLRIYVTKNP